MTQIQGERVAASVQSLSHELDPTLCTTTISAKIPYLGSSKVLDVEGVANCRVPAIDPYHKEHPDPPIIGTETAGTLTELDIYTEDATHCALSGYDTYVTFF